MGCEGGGGLAFGFGWCGIKVVGGKEDVEDRLEGMQL